MFSVKCELRFALAAGMPLVLASALSGSPVKAASVQCNLIDIGTTCNSLTTGDKLVNGFNLNGYIAQAGDTIILTDVDPFTYTLQFNLTPPQLGLKAGLFDYTVAIVNPSLAAGFTMKDYYANATGGGDGFTTSVTATSSIAPPSVSPPVPGNKVFFNSGVTSSTFAQSWSAPVGATIASFGVTLDQQVPGPLPLLGAGAAFGFSRKLRRRIKQAA